MTNSFGLIALDMDGTLLRADKTIHPDTAEDIAAAAAAGIEVAYCTGRSPVELLPYVKDLPAMRYAIALSGAYVCDLDGGCIFERRIPQKLALRLVEEGERYRAMVQFLKSDRSIVRADLIPRMAEFHMAAFQTLYEQVATGVSDLTDGALSQNGVHKINIYFRNTEDRDKAYDALKDLPLTFALTENTMLEAGAAGVSKAEGLRALADHLHIPISATMAIGDSDNDIPVLQAAGFSVAMKNSEEKVIALCDAVTDDNENNGVGKAIRRYCLAACPDPGIVNDSASFPEAAEETGITMINNTMVNNIKTDNARTDNSKTENTKTDNIIADNTLAGNSIADDKDKDSLPVVISDTAAQAEDVCGVLLCGGKSRRMGVDKASLPWGSGTFLQAAASRLDMFSEKYLSVSANANPNANPNVNANADADQDAGAGADADAGAVSDSGSGEPQNGQSERKGLAPDWIVLPDKVPDCGPIGGIYTALSTCTAGWAMVVSCDVPKVEESLLRVLMAGRTAEAEIVYPVTSDGRMHLTCALYRKSLLPVLEQHIAAHDYRLRSLLDKCRAAIVPLDSAQDSFLEDMLANINTPEDLENVKTAPENRGRREIKKDRSRQKSLSETLSNNLLETLSKNKDKEQRPLACSKEFYLQDDGIRIHCKLDFPDNKYRQSVPAGMSIQSGPDSVSVSGWNPVDRTEGDCDPGTQKLPLLIIFHGFTGHMEEDHIRAVARTANETGYAALRAELYGHGRSGGDFRDHTLLKWISNALTVIDYARSLPFVSEILVCGHSQGGLLTMLAGAMEQDHLKAILPLSPAWMIPETARRGEVLGTIFEPEKIPEKLAAGKGLCLGGTYLRTAQMVEVEPSIRRFKKPVLLVHGSADLAVPVDCSVRAAEMYPDARLVIIPEDTHCYDFHLDQVVEAVRAFLAEQLNR